MLYLYQGSELTLVELKNTLTAEVTLLRQNTLDKFQRSSPGVARVYMENLLAAQRYISGKPDAMSNGMSPTDYLTGLGQPLGFHAAQFADYIMTQNHLLGMAAYAVEQGYLQGKALFMISLDGDAMIAWMEAYRTSCLSIAGS